MNWRSRLFNWRRDRRLDAEIQFHLDEQAREFMDAGMSKQEAQRKARLAFGAIDPIKDDCRQGSPSSIAESIVQDVRYAFRGMWRSWIFSIVVVLSLAWGIGANTAIFTLIDAVMWRNLPVREPETLLVAGRAPGPAPTAGFTYKQFRLMHDNGQVADVAGYSIAPINVSISGNIEPTANGQLVSGNYFAVLGVNAIAGRTIGPDDDRIPNGHPVVMISYRYWNGRFGRDPSTIGKTISVSSIPFTIIGVTPPEFFGVEVGASPDIFVPIMMQPTVMPAYENLVENPIITKTWVQTIARLNDGVTIQQAAAVLDPLQREQIPLPPPGLKSGLRDQKLVLTPASTGLSELRRQFSQGLFILMAVVATVLLIACANTANLLLAKAAARRPEFAMRLALGSGRARLMRQLVIESMVLAGFGGIAGILLARWSTALLLRYISSGRNPIVLDLNPDARILVFTTTVSILTGILFGLAPAFRATRVDLISTIKNASALRNSRSGLHPGKALAIAQVSLSLLLLIGAALFVRSLQNLISQDSGVSRDDVLIVRVEPKGSDQRNLPGVSQRLDRIYTELLDRVRSIPGVRAASLGNVSPTKPDSGAGIRRTLPSGEILSASGQVVYPQYFETLGIPIVKGRDLGPGDLASTSPAVCVINEAFARTFFPGEDPIGKPCGGVLRTPGARGVPVSAIVGVAKDSRYTTLRGETQAVVYTPFIFANTGRGQMILFVRAAGKAASLLPLIRDEVWRADKSVPQFEVHSLDQEVDAALIQDRLIATLSSLFSVLALLLACVGLYGLLSFSVVQRTAEMGIRMALGAKRTDVVWMIMREALLLVAGGIVIGVTLAVALGRIASNQMSGLLFGLQPNDPRAIAFATVLLLAVATMAAYLPARRASRVDPMIALRNE